MTKRIVAWILGALFVSSAAIAAPAYDSPAWESYIEQGKGTLPSGTPHRARGGRWYCKSQ